MNAVQKQVVVELLNARLGTDIRISQTSSVGGGCINEATRINTSGGTFFVKWNDAKKYPGMLEAEAKGLLLLEQAQEIRVPKVIEQAIVDATQYLILEYIESEAIVTDFWIDFGRSLARLHKHSSGTFGLNHPNYIGWLPQSNNQHSTWIEFFIRERLKPQIKLAVDSHRIDKRVVVDFDRLFSQLESIFPVEKPSLLHGDLWSGNYIIGSKGEPCIIDPAVYYGHREMDLAMSRLFGGFAPDFYKGYQAEFPLGQGWEQRMDICNLYPLLVHVNLFGGGYVAQVEGILRRF